MELDESHQYELRQQLDAVLGPRPAALLMSQMATKSDLDALRIATKQDLEALRASTTKDMETLRLGILADLRAEMLQMTHRLYFGMAGIVFTAVSLSFVAARLGA